MKLARFLANFAFYIYPILLILTIIIAEATLPLSDKRYFYSEFGAIELAHEFMLLVSFLFGIWLVSKVKPTENKWLKIWIGLIAAGCFLSLGEEISWGQTFFDWQTPEEWAALNGQGETNFHNMSHWLNQLPKAVFEIGVLIGGIILPQMNKYKPHKLPAKFSAIYADRQVLPTAILALIIKILELAPGKLGIEIFWRKSEVIESVLFHFALVYMISIAFKWKREGRLE